MALTLIKIAKKYYFILIAIVLFISYGQILFMLPWQDDNALFFKLAHIQRDAGFMGPGLLGSGPYKYTAFFYYPIYLLFHFQPFYYFAFGFVLYVLSTFLVYKVVSKILDKNTGMLAGFLYACGFIGSESFIRIFNSVITSLSIILVLLVVYAYYKFYKVRRIRWFFLSLVFFLLASNFAKARTHYLIAIPAFIELYSLVSKKLSAKSFLNSFLRISLFLPITYYYVILADFRSQGAIDFFSSIARGSYYNMFGFLTSLSHILIPEEVLGLISPSGVLMNDNLNNGLFYFLGISILTIVVCIFIFCKYKKTRTGIIVFLILSFIWKIVSSRIFISPKLNIAFSQTLIAFIGGEIVILAFLGFFAINRKHKFLYSLFLAGFFANLLSYSAYNPLQVYEKINRYFSHSFLFLVCLFALIYYAVSNVKLKNTILVIVIIWGFYNMLGAFFYQRHVLNTRTIPVKNFYGQLELLLPHVKKGDVLYFDIKDTSRANFNDAFSVAQMPDTTAIAWRDGLDRYDFQMFDDTSNFFSYLRNNQVGNDSLHTFFYSRDGLLDTTNDVIHFFKDNKSLDLKVTTTGSEMNNGILEVDQLKISSFTPFKLAVDIKATLYSVNDVKFPFYLGSLHLGDDNFFDMSTMNMVFDYKKFLQAFRKTKIIVSSDWQGRSAENLTDGDFGSPWEADRLLWLKNPQYLVMTADENQSYNRLVFINTYSDHTPLEFDILGSLDKSSWSFIDTFRNSNRFENGQEVVFNFPTRKFKYFKISFKKTLNGDAPAVSEIWLVPSKFSNLDILKTEKFLMNPFGYVPNEFIYNALLKNVNYLGNIKLSWVNNKTFGWQDSTTSRASVIFDGKTHTYEIPVVPGGTLIDKIRFELLDFPGEISVSSIKADYSLR